MPSNAAYTTQPQKGEFPEIGSRWFNIRTVGNNQLPCPANLETGYEVSSTQLDYDYDRPTEVTWIDTFYLVLNLKTPINQQDNQVRYISSRDNIVVDSAEPYDPERRRSTRMRQLFDFDVATYCGERYPHNDPPPPQSTSAPVNGCPAIQSSLNWFKP